MTLIVIILLTILVTSLIIAHLTKPTVYIPFKESMDLINLPVVTFINNNIERKNAPSKTIIESFL